MNPVVRLLGMGAMVLVTSGPAVAQIPPNMVRCQHAPPGADALCDFLRQMAKPQTSNVPPATPQVAGPQVPSAQEHAVTDAFDASIRLWRREHNPEGAIAQLDQVLTIAPNNVWAHLRRGFLYGQMPQPEKALQSYDKAIALAPNDPDPYVERGKYYAATKQYDLALADMDKAGQLDPSTRDLDRHRGVIYLHKGDYRNALAAFDRDVQMSPYGDVRSYVLRGLTLLRLGQKAAGEADIAFAGPIHDQYAQDIREAEAAAPLAQPMRLPTAKSVADAKQLIAQHHGRDALTVLDAILAENTNDRDALMARGQAFFSLREYKMSQRDAEQAIRLRPDAPAYVLLGADDEALEDVSPTSQQAAVALQNAHGPLPISKAGAYVDVSEAIDLDPKFAQAYVDRALYVDLGQYIDTATTDIETAVAAGPKDAFAWYVRALLVGPERLNPGDFMTHNFGRASGFIMENLDKALAFEPNMTNAYVARGETYLAEARLSHDPTKAAQLKVSGEHDLSVAYRMNPLIKTYLEFLTAGRTRSLGTSGVITDGLLQWYLTEKVWQMAAPPALGDPCLAYLHDTSYAACRAHDAAAAQRLDIGNLADVTDEMRDYGDHIPRRFP